MTEIGLDQTDAGRAQAAAPGDTVVVALDETPTSGYRWTVDAFEPAVLAAAGDEYIPSSSALGGGGVHRFRFEVVGASSSRIRLILRRPWDPDSIVDTFETTIEATAGPTPHR
jgi:inhibitor of cysteine peptidase